MLFSGFAAALTGTAIITTLLSSRIHYIAQMVVSFTFSGIVQPTLLHSASIYSGWMAENRLEDIDVSFKDTAMVLATSIASSTAGMVGCIFLGRRVLRVCNTDPSSIGPTSPGTTVCGYFFILLGFAALALPSPVMEEMQASVDFDVNLVINASVSFAMGIFVVAVFHAMFYQGPVTYWDVLKCFQGGVAGFISVLAAYDLYSPLPSLFIALTGATFFFLATEYVFSSPLEDNCNIIAIHLVCGILSCLMPTFFSHKENIGFRAGISVHSNMMHLAWQVLCCSVVIVVVCIFYTFIFCLLLLFKVLRNKSERSAHERAKRLMKTGGSIVKNEPITDYILPNIAHKGLRNVNKKPVPAAATKMHTYNVSVNTAEDIQLYDGPGTSVEIGDFKVRRASFSHDAVQKSGNISKDKMRRKFQKCKNVFVRNPLHRDSFL